MHKEYKRLSIEFPTDEYVYLKMACAKQGVSMKEFVTTAITMYMEDYEDKLAIEAFNRELTEDNIKKAIPLDQLISELGFDEKKVQS